MDPKTRKSLWFCFAVSVVATATSLFWSLVLQWLPCDLCWYERICMYPIVLISALALARRDAKSRLYVSWLSAIGALIALYHYLLQMVPALNRTTGCTSIVSCAVPDFQWLGFVTPPLLAFLAFCLLFASSTVYPRRPKQ